MGLSEIDSHLSDRRSPTRGREKYAKRDLSICAVADSDGSRCAHPSYEGQSLRGLALAMPPIADAYVAQYQVPMFQQLERTFTFGVYPRRFAFVPSMKEY